MSFKGKALKHSITQSLKHGFASKNLFHPRLPQKEHFTHRDLSGNIPPQTFEKPRRLFFHSLQFTVRHFALQSIPTAKAVFKSEWSRAFALAPE
jgi:hypothetical protein